MKVHSVQIGDSDESLNVHSNLTVECAKTHASHTTAQLAKSVGLISSRFTEQSWDGDTFMFHHLVPLSEVTEDYKLDPIKDLRPDCPNWHVMLSSPF